MVQIRITTVHGRGKISFNDHCKTYLIEAGPDFIEVVMLRDQETKKGYLKSKRFISLSVDDLIIRLSRIKKN